MSQIFLNTTINYLPGVGPNRAQILQKELGIFQYKDFIELYPIRFEDRSKILSYTELNEHSPSTQVLGTLTAAHLEGNGKNRRLVANLKISGGVVQLVWFKRISYFEKVLDIGKQYLVFGQPKKFGQGYSFTHPELKEFKTNLIEDKEVGTGFTPIYPSTSGLKKAFISNEFIKSCISHILRNELFTVNEYLPASVVRTQNLLPRLAAYQLIHFPKKYGDAKAARERIAFDEFFFLQYKSLRINKTRKEKLRGFIFGEIGAKFREFYDHHLGFELTGAQKRVIKEIRKDLGSGYQMNRLLQGDVGSGKTIVATMVSIIAIENGFQCALVAPTEILALQHYNTLAPELQKVGISCALLTGSTSIGERKNVLSQLENGELNVLVGTHALMEAKVAFSNLGLAIIDEQHKFGVAQRSKLWTKNNAVPHVLVMTATPIPRTLAMSIYGDLDVSVIDELPKGRKPVTTVWKTDNERLAIMTFLKDQINEGKQVYIVFPLIEKSSKLDLKDLMNGYNMVVDHFPLPKYQVGIMHGKLGTDEKEKVMNLFNQGTTDILISTTVIEVGVNVPNASVMVIENAERFGLSQLHQLRGRVGRGSDKSYCILVSSHKLSKNGKERLGAMVKTNNGFEIAAIDLKLRGPGNIEGTRQSGVLDLKVADIVKDEPIMQKARLVVKKLLDEDPNLEREEHQYLKALLNQKSKTSGWSRIS